MKKQTQDRTLMISRRLDCFMSSRIISTHLERWGWLDGVAIEEVRRVRVRRTREDLRLLMEVNNLQVEGTLEMRLGLKKALGQHYRTHYKYGSRLRPAQRPRPLP